MPGDGVEEPDAGGAAVRPGAAAGEQPAGAGSLREEPALPAGAAGQQDLRADGAARHAGQAGGGQLELRHRPTSSPTQLEISSLSSVFLFCTH